MTAPSEAALIALQQHLHALIRERADEFGFPVPPDLPDLAALAESVNEEAWFPVPGMYGGFAYQLGEPGTTLTVSSWSRVCEGSGQRHEITSDGCRLTDEGFV